jgi:hypothetical protein
MEEYRVTGDAGLAQSRQAPLRDYLLDAGLATVSEIFVGTASCTPWHSVTSMELACVLEAWVKLESIRRGKRKEE